ncbi:hypothetical protein CMUS01_12813 [Colletotrichum musicola]|uniref:SnoaL-like domain-containing protein n=1 Tax=Colletotrichum musicola TaxID=2175873 RepID=A0A8H6MZ60_9PEZI|nr:hypothetical protein CMUS01_12813 [Colletotrichum musicola]
MASTDFQSVLRQRMVDTIQAFMATYQDASVQKDASLINRNSTSNCTRHLLPASVTEAFNLPSDFFFDNAGIEVALASDLKVLKFEDAIISNVVIDTQALRAAFTTISKIRTDAGERYNAEGAWTLYFTVDGTKVKKVIEFCDKDVLVRMAGESK